DAEVLVRHDHHFGQPPAERLALGAGLDDRGEIGAAVGEEVFDAARREQAQPGVGCRFGSEADGFGFEGYRMVWFHYGVCLVQMNLTCYVCDEHRHDELRGATRRD